MPGNVTIKDLRKVVALSEMPDEHLQWILERGIYREYRDGDIIVNTGDPIDIMWIILNGRMVFKVNKNDRPAFEHIFENDQATQGVSGLMPYSRMKASPGFAVAENSLRIIGLHKEHFRELERMNPAFIQRCIAIMTDRARAFATKQLQEEKVSALGKLAAGIAHEINNPASAINRFADELTKRLLMNYDLTERLLIEGVSGKHIGTLRAMIESRNRSPGKQEKLGMQERIDKENEIAGWLADHGFGEYAYVSETFADQGMSTDDFKSILQAFGEKAFPPVLLWLENLVTSQQTINDLGEASRRISKLVGAIKSHVHMDRTGDLQLTNVQHDIATTLTLLGHKIRSKNIKVSHEYDEAIPQVEAYISELNQVWTNLIDNAVDALDKNGEIRLVMSSNAKDVHVQVIDNGHGIPEDILNRIFDPFFTTKKVGKGTGIGLDLVKRIVKHHHGDIRVQSRPGNTEFSICLPIRQPAVPEADNKTDLSE